jgi:ABC-2 type transport system ATP-binding protein
MTLAVGPIPAVEFKNTKKIYFPGTKKESVALKSLNLKVMPGEFFGLLGHNGAGKSTAIGMMSGTVNITEGDVLIYGHSIITDSTSAKLKLGVVCQELVADSFFDLRTMLRLQSKLSGVKPDIYWLDFLLERLALSGHVKKTTRELSGGMKRRMMIARALAHKPMMVVLDEPTAGVDVDLRHSMWEFINELHKTGRTIILTTHYLEEAEAFCQRLAILKNGELVTLKKREELMELGGKPMVVARFPEEFSPELLQKNLGSFPDAVLSKHQGKYQIGITFNEKDMVSLSNAHGILAQLIQSNGLAPESMSVQKPTLEQVFLNLSR